MPDLSDDTVTIVTIPTTAPRIGAVLPAPATAFVLPVPGPPGQAGTSGAGFIFTKTTPAAVWEIEHGIGRSVISVTVYSLDYSIEWTNVVVQPTSSTHARLSFDDPTSGIALIL